MFQNEKAIILTAYMLNILKVIKTEAVQMERERRPHRSEGWYQGRHERAGIYPRGAALHGELTQPRMQNRVRRSWKRNCNVPHTARSARHQKKGFGELTWFPELLCHSWQVTQAKPFTGLHVLRQIMSKLNCLWSNQVLSYLTCSNILVAPVWRQILKIYTKSCLVP